MSVINGYRYLINEGGVTSLWRGNGINVLKIIPETALRFTFFEEVIYFIRNLSTIDLNFLLDKKNCKKNAE
jgi:solute carrier family 25 phosphate transporter 23/24/25/41